MKGRRQQGTQRNCSAVIRCAAEPAGAKLAALVKRKHGEVAELLHELGEEALELRLKDSVNSPRKPSFSFAQAIAAPRQYGLPAIVLEIGRKSPMTTSQQLAELARAYETLGIDAIAVRTDSEDTAQGLLDLLEVRRAVKIPVMRKELILHPIQVVEAKEAGAAGVIGTVTSVLQGGTPTLTSYGAAIGMDCPVEVVNMDEMTKVEKYNVPLYGINITVGLSVPITGFADTVMKNLVEKAPFGSMTIVGAKSTEDAETAVRAGADAAFLKWELLERMPLHEVRDLVNHVKYVGSGDD